MIDAITNQIIEKLDTLPIKKRKAILELINENIIDLNIDPDFSKQEWRKKLLTTSTWTEPEINDIKQARKYLNKWKPKQF